MALPIPGFDESAIFCFPAWGDKKLLDAVDELLETRQIVDGRQITDNSKEARVKFFDTQCSGVENLVDEDAQGAEVDLMDLADWKERIAGSWKTSVVSQNFEERGTLTAADVKN
jgi:hypothetical protein